jgi:hypothetical protein
MRRHPGFGGIRARQRLRGLAGNAEEKGGA